jgi:hypothetical protein
MAAEATEMAHRIIYHYEVPSWSPGGGDYTIASDLPAGAEVLCARNRLDKVVVYVAQDAKPPKLSPSVQAPRIEAFYVLTGEEFQDHIGWDAHLFIYVDTVTINAPSGRTVAHVYARRVV